MTAPTIPDGDLLTRARKLAADLGQTPSRNQLMTELRVGAPRAKAVLSQLLAERRQRAEQHRRTLRRLPSRTRPRPLPARWVRHAPPIPVSPGVGPVAPMAFPQVAPSDAPPRPASVVAPKGGSEVGLKRPHAWPVLLLTGPAFVAIWAGWVALGALTGFGEVNLLPGIGSGWVIDTAITLPVGMETYAAYALYVWLHPGSPARARRFAARSTIAGLCLGAGGQVAYHLMAAAGVTAAPWWITTVVACLPVAVLGMGAALAHLVRSEGVR